MIGQRLRLLLVAVVIIAACLVLFYRLWFLQIEKQEEYINKQPVTATARQRVPATRGRILDRNGREMARNETCMEIALDLSAVEASWKEREKNKPRKERRALPTFAFGPRKEETTDIVALLNETVFPELDRLKLFRVPDDPEERKKQQKKQQEAIIRSYTTNKGVIPYTYEKNLFQADDKDFIRFTAYAENAPNIPGLTIAERPKRRYPFKAMAGHLLGFIRENRDVLPPDEVKAMEQNKQKWDYLEAEDFGVAGLEQSQDDKLRGKPGERIWLKNEHGRLTDEIKEQRRDPLPGADVFLTIDVRVQMIAEMALREAGVGRGAIVVMNCNTGEIRGIASVPSFDPSIFIPPQNVAAMEALFDDPTDPAHALALRADLSGSTFKLMTAFAGSMAGVDGRSYNCPGFINYGRPIACWIHRQSGGSHGMLDLTGGIMNSCNCYFFQLGNAATIDKLDEAAGYFGFGIPGATGSSGIELPPGIESNGYIGSNAWKVAQGFGKWTSADTAYVSIGQGMMGATPLQVCMLGAAVANGGKVYQPTLINHTEEWQYDRDGQRRKVISEFKPRLRADLLQHGVKKHDIDNMREGMRKVVNDPHGTGRNAASKIWIIAGKTGTAQKKRLDENHKSVVDNRTLFMSFAPYEKPTIAVSIFVLNGESGGKTAAPIAKRVIEQVLAMDAGNYDPHPAPLEPAKGHFKKLDLVVFPGDNVPADAGTEETGEETEDEAPDIVVTPKVTPPAPKAVVIEEEDTNPLKHQMLEPVKFRYKTDPPNPPDQPGGVH